MPLELRQQIYEDMLPRDRMLTFDTTRHWPSEQTMKAAYEADARLRSELQDWARQRCGLRIVISPNSRPPPADIPFHSIRRLELFIDHYDHKDGGYSLRRLHFNISRVAAMLSKHASLQQVTIRFRDEHTGTIYADDHWTARIIRVERRRGSVLDKIGDGPPIVNYLLNPLLQLPVCKRVGVPLLRNVVPFEGWAHPGPCDDDYGPIFDKRYMKKLFGALAVWLQSDRSIRFQDYWEGCGGATC